MRWLVWAPTKILNRGIGLTVVRSRAVVTPDTLLTKFETHLWTTAVIASGYSAWWSDAVFCRAKFVQVGKLRAPIMWRVYWWTTTLDVGFNRPKKRREVWSFSRNPTCKKILSLLAETTYSKLRYLKISWRNLKTTKMRIWRRSGRTNRDLFKEALWHFDAPLRARRSLSGLLGFNSEWCGRYHSR